MVEAFSKTTRDLGTMGADIQLSGSTCVCVVLRRNMIVVGNVGDSRAVLGSMEFGQWKAIPLSNDHKPDLPAEHERIIRMGGIVEPMRIGANRVGPARVWISRDSIPGLAMSRSFGDLVAASVGVTSIPEFMSHILTPSDRFLVVGSDGLWEFLSNEEVINIVGRLILNS
jgi:serine/threonine protein phosphatase PrpC